MCLGPQVQRSNQRQNLNADVLISGGVGRRPGTNAARDTAQTNARAVTDPLRALNERQEAGGGNLLRGLMLPEVNATGVPDLKHLSNILITPRGR